MSEFFEPGAGIDSHLEGVRNQVEALHKRNDIPQGLHIDMVLGMADIGGEYGAVFLRGDQGSGKTTLASAILGSNSVIDIGENDTAETLLGYEKQFSDSYAAGSIGALILRSDDDIRITLDELGHIENGRPLHRLWNGTGFFMHDRTRHIDTSSMSLIATANHENPSAGVFRIHKELMDRFGGALDFPADIESPTRRKHEPGLVAPTKVRQDLRDYLERAHPEHASVKPFIKALVTEMDKTGMFVRSELPKGARPVGSALQAVRARRLVSTEELDPSTKRALTAKDPRWISKLDIPEVAAFSLGKTARLNNEAIATFASALGEKLTEHEKAVIARRIVSALARKTMWESFKGTKYEKPKEIIEASTVAFMKDSTEPVEESLLRKVHGVSRLEIIDEVIIRKLFSGTGSTADRVESDQTKSASKDKQNDGKSVFGRIFSRRSAQ